MTRNSNQYPELYKSLGIKLNDLGCIMLDTEAPFSADDYELEKDLYFAKNPEFKWINGAVGTRDAHVTLLYGLLEKGPVWQEHVDTVLDGWTAEPVEIEEVGIFPSPFDTEPYGCIVAKLTVTDNLLDAHKRLSLLPHINTYADYTPHVTLAYVTEDSADYWQEVFSWDLEGKVLKPKGLNYGGTFSV